MSVRPAIYLTNLATVSACRRGGGHTGPAVGGGPVIGILRRPPAWSERMLAGHIRALMPSKRELFQAKAGILGWEAYRARLRERWQRSDLRPGYLRIAQYGRDPNTGESWRWDGDDWWPSVPVPSQSTLVCSCAVGEHCHRQLAAEMLAEAGWYVVLDGQAVLHTEPVGEEQAR